MHRGDIIRMAFTVLFYSKTIKILCAFDLLFSRHSLLAALLASSTKQAGIKLIAVVMLLYWPVLKGVSVCIEKYTISHLKVFPIYSSPQQFLVILFSLLSIEWSLLFMLTLRESPPNCAKFNRCHLIDLKESGCGSENAWLKWCAGSPISFIFLKV